MKQNHTEIVFVVDRSGSMAGIAKAMQEGYEKLIEDQRKVVGTCDVTLAQFDDKYESVSGAALNYDQCTYNASLNTDGKTS